MQRWPSRLQLPGDTRNREVTVRYAMRTIETSVHVRRVLHRLCLSTARLLPKLAQRICYIDV